jgi:putative Mn2+ efflux pump MntP
VNFFLVLGVALALAMDAFAISIGVSLILKGLSAQQTFRLALHFGLFQFVMPIGGWAAGKSVIRRIESYDHWVAAGLLLVIAAKMIYESLKGSERSGKKSPDPTRGFSLVMLSVATSLDALAVGLSLAALHVPILYPAAIIGIVAFCLTAVGTRIGPAIGRLIGRSAELAGGLVLVAIAIKILADHLK